MNLKRRRRIIQNKFCPSSYADFPFLVDRPTISYLRKRYNKVVFISRGLPGSGKSYISNKIVKCYPLSSYVCSADFYFTSNNDNTYNFCPEKLSDAHQLCKKSFLKATVVGKRHIIVDNTNIQRWEMDFYIKTANQHNYLVLIVEPRTPWKSNVEKLQKLNKHGCTSEYIECRKCLFHPITPYFWGFFVNEYESYLFTKFAEKKFYECLSLFKEFGNDLSAYSENLEYKTIYNVNFQKLLHCTTYFEKELRDLNSNEGSYSSHSDVVGSLGRHFKLTVSGLIFTPRTSGVLIKLDKRCLKIWESEDAFMYKLDKDGKLIPSSSDEKTLCEDEISEAIYKKISPLSLNNELPNNCLSNVSEFIPVNQRIELKVGSRAHLTIGCTDGIEAVQTGFDVLSLKYKYQQSDCMKICYKNDCSYIYYGEGECQVLFDWPMQVDSLFAGYYQ